MLDKKTIQFVRSLREKNARYSENLFIAEGKKSIEDILTSGFEGMMLFSTDEKWLKQQKISKNGNAYIIGESDIHRLSSLKSTSEAIGVFKFISYSLNNFKPKGKITLILDTIQDPGNLGTIIRIADWYGIESIICSPQTVDVYNAKVIQSSMGSIGRVKLYYTDLLKFIANLEPSELFVSTLNEAMDTKEIQFPSHVYLIIGNEGQGVSDELITIVKNRIKINRIGSAESLNAAVATAILCDRICQNA